MAAMKATHTPPILDLDTGMTPADLLRGAARYLFMHGWKQGDFFDLLSDKPFPPACSLGAINICAHGRPILCSDDESQDADTDAAITAMRVLAAYLDPDYSTTVDIFAYMTSAIDIVSGWNDEDDRTIGEVIETLTDAADNWDRAHTTGGAR
ncbi:hypothetical protein [Actinoplanes sp. NPDC049118]|uniref:DUF6197 family protein n=1 Tax=Actinoplanes sp. NPDC049118 TaxID=3155769 RepID=UPI0033F4EF1F